MDSQKFVFKENLFRINDLKFVWDGFVQMKENNQILTNLELKFKDILSLIPAIYANEFKELKTSGNIHFHAFVKGVL